jgi:hypothetical protein
MQQNHSPLPWSYGHNIIDAKGISVQVDVLCVGKRMGGEVNAQFIVQACNAHGILLQACKDALYYLRQCEMDFSLPPSAKTMKDILSEAIAKVEGK